jgi:putative transcriptional regulator
MHQSRLIEDKTSHISLPSQWAYDSGKVIEQGAVILGGVEQDFGFGLRQQYFHKAVILVLDHDEKKFTKGIILNRPSEKVIADDVNEGVEWRVWFGGDVQGLDSILPDIVCLHSLKDEEAKEVSETVMKDIQVSYN